MLKQTHTNIQTKLKFLSSSTLHSSSRPSTLNTEKQKLHLLMINNSNSWENLLFLTSSNKFYDLQHNSHFSKYRKLTYVAQTNFKIGIFNKEIFLLLEKFLSVSYGLKFLYGQRNMMWDRSKKVNFALERIFKSHYMKDKFETSSGYLPQCVATMHCFLSKWLNQNSENCTQLESWACKSTLHKKYENGN